MNILNRRSETKDELFLGQNFQQLKQYCQLRRLRFIDDMFPPDRRSIGRDLLSPADLSRVVWQRPSVGVFTHTYTQTHRHTHNHKLFSLLQKLVANPSFTVEGMSRFDFGQGILGEKTISLAAQAECDRRPEIGFINAATVFSISGRN